MSEEEKQPFLGHLEELRKRLIYCAIAAAIGFVICYAFKEILFSILVSPLKDQLSEDSKMIFTNLTEGFFTYLKTAFVAGLLLASPFIFHQIWMFVAPGLYKNEKKYVIPFVISSTILFMGGALFAYYIVFPFGFKFFLGYENEFTQAMPSIKQYFSFAVKLLFAFGLVFEIPVVIFFLSRMGLVTASLLRKKRKYAILLTFAMAAILTPPDIITQCMMAVPLIALYEIGIIIAWLTEKKKAKAEDASDEETKS